MKTSNNREYISRISHDKSTCTAIFHATVYAAPIAFVIGINVSSHKNVVEKTAAVPAPCNPTPIKIISYGITNFKHTDL